MKVLLALVLGIGMVCPVVVPTALAQPTPCDGSDPNCVYVPYTCNYDVLCDPAGNVIPGPPNGVRLGNGQYCAGNGCTRP